MVLPGAFPATLPLHISHFCKHFTSLVNRKAVESRLWKNCWRAREISGPCGNTAGQKPVPELQKSFLEGVFFPLPTDRPKSEVLLLASLRLGKKMILVEVKSC